MHWDRNISCFCFTSKCLWFS